METKKQRSNNFVFFSKKEKHFLQKDASTLKLF